MGVMREESVIVTGQLLNRFTKDEKSELCYEL